MTTLAIFLASYLLPLAILLRIGWWLTTSYPEGEE